jgi:4-coumarate--CoA ligase
MFTVSKVKFILTEPDLLENVAAAAKSSNISDSRIWIYDTALPQVDTDFGSWRELLNHGESGWIVFDDEALSRGTVAALMSTSGTTGLPKAAQSSHYSQVAQSVMLKEKDKPWDV